MNVTRIRSKVGEIVSVVVTMQDMAPFEELGAVAGGVLGMGSHERRGPMDRDGPVLLHQRRAGRPRAGPGRGPCWTKERIEAGTLRRRCRSGSGTARTATSRSPVSDRGRSSLRAGFRTSSASAPAGPGGTGLGLAIWQGLVEGPRRSHPRRELPRRVAPDVGRAPGSRLCSVRSFG